MSILKIIKKVYVLYSILIILSMSCTSLNLMDVLPGLLIMWICFFMYFLGYISRKKYNIVIFNNSFDNNWLIKGNKNKLFFIGLLSIISSILVVRFYTGQTPISVFRNLANGASLYSVYQNYFRENQIGVFSLTKIPFIGMQIFLKFILVYSYVSYGLFKSKIYLYEKFYLILITISIIFIGIARGTSFEFFELFILFLLITFFKFEKKKMTSKILKKYILIILLGGIMVFVFYYGITLREVKFDFKISNDIYYNPDGLLPRISNFLSIIIITLFGYFGFGFFYMSRYVRDIWFASIENFIAGFIPLGIRAFSSQSIRDQMRFLIDMGARWHPDIAGIIDLGGFIGLLMFSFSIGMFSRFLKNQSEAGKENILVYITYYFILLQMISLPIGNFIIASSANKFIVTILTIIWCGKLLRLPRICLIKKHT